VDHGLPVRHGFFRQRIKLLQGAFNVDRDAVAAGKNCTTRPG